MLGHSCIRAVVGAQSNTSHPKKPGCGVLFCIRAVETAR